MASSTGATAIDVDVRQADGLLTLEVSDDGRGIGSAGDREGSGLLAMDSRAASLGGTLEVESGGAGTTVRLEVPLEPHP